MWTMVKMMMMNGWEGLPSSGLLIRMWSRKLLMAIFRTDVSLANCKAQMAFW